MNNNVVSGGILAWAEIIAGWSNTDSLPLRDAPVVYRAESRDPVANLMAIAGISTPATAGCARGDNRRGGQLA